MSQYGFANVTISICHILIVGKYGERVTTVIVLKYCLTW